MYYSLFITRLKQPEGQQLKSTNQIAPLLVQYFLRIGPGNVPNDPERDLCVAMACKRETITFSCIEKNFSYSLFPCWITIGNYFSTKKRFKCSVRIPFILNPFRCPLLSKYKNLFQSCNKSLINLACLGPYWENIGPRSFLKVLSRPRADVLWVRPSRLVNKMYTQP